MPSSVRFLLLPSVVVLAVVALVSRFSGATAAAFRSTPLAPAATTTTTRRGFSSAVVPVVVVGASAARGGDEEKEKRRDVDEDDDDDGGGVRFASLSPSSSSSSRRSFVARSAAASAAAIPFALYPPPPSLAVDDSSSPSSSSSVLTFERSTSKYAYKFQPPPDFVQGKKPLQTHLDEVNFNKEGARGYTFGITVDPVRIGSLREFGTPEEVAARVVTAEVNRDGIFEVTQAVDPVELPPPSGAYRIEYVSDGKRGKKRFITKIDIRGGMLYVLTCQSKQEEFDEERRNEMERALESFVVTKE